MVNAKGVAFKVNKQTPISKAPPHAYGTVINCRKPAGKRAKAQQKELQSHYVAFTNIEGTLKRKRGEEQVIGPDGTSAFSVPGYQGVNATSISSSSASSRTSSEVPAQIRTWQAPKPLRARKLKLPSIGVDLDCWFIIMSYADPAQLLVLRSKIPSCFYYLRDNPMLWKLSRKSYYGDDLPEPPSELTEFQYADLRHDHGCQSHDCRAPNTRKTYWAFLRRWCKTCLQDKALKEHEALVELRKVYVPTEEGLMLQKCLPSGIFDSWGNFVGVGPATTHALKTVYLKRDVERLVEQYSQFKADLEAQSIELGSTGWQEKLSAWYKPKADFVQERKAFAHKMEAWEETLRNNRTYEYSAKKAARKAFFQQKASELNPAISVREMECCPSYKRAVAIPKDPNNTSWLQLKPKLEKEAAELKSKSGPPENRIQASSTSGTTTPTSVMEPPLPHRFTPGLPARLGFQTSAYGMQGHTQGFQQQGHVHLSTLHPPLLPPPPRQSHPYPPLQGNMITAPPPPPIPSVHPGFPTANTRRP